MANPDNPNGFVPECYMGGMGAFPVWEGYTISNGTIASGDALALTNGLIRVALNSDTTILGVAAEPITGVAATRAKVSFYPALPQFVFSGQGDGSNSQGDIGDRIGILGTTGIQEIDSAGSSTSVAMIVGLKDGSAWGANARMYFTWCRSAFYGKYNV